MSEKGWGKTVLGWFVVADQEKAATDASSPASMDDADAIIRKYSGSGEAPPPPPVEIKGPLPGVVNGQVDLIAVYEAAGVDNEERDRVAKAQELLRSLPAETPVPVKKQIV